jgi:8-oxo-dGTP pyrophosphatase MutT (NUDIX family)
MPEYFDLLDPSTGLKTGHNELRSTVHKNGLHHACIHLWIFDIFKNTILDSEEANIGDVTTEVKVLLQRRSKAKESYPYFFDISSAGHLSSGENDFVCLTRELYEELGVLLDFELPPGVSQTELDEIWKGIYEHKNIDEHKPDHPDLQKAVVHAQYIYNTTFLSVKPDTKAMMEYNVTISTSANPTFYESTTLYFCGKFWQYNVVGKDYIDNELATIFFLKGFFRTQEQINCEEKNDNIENDNFEQDNDTNTTFPSNNSHILTFLDDEVASVAYVPLNTYLALQNELTQDQKTLHEQLTPLLSTESPQQNQSSIEIFDRTVFDNSHETKGDALDILDKSWLVPITNLEMYSDLVFKPMMKLGE